MSRVFLVVVGVLALAVPVRGQVVGERSGASADTLRLTLSEAVRLAAERSAGVAVERLAAEEGEAALLEEKSGYLPQASVRLVGGDRTFNTASFGLEFPVPAGGTPLFDPNGEVVGPVRTWDARATVEQTLFDWALLRRISAARAELNADRAAEEVAREVAASRAATAYVQASRARDRLVAREADVSLAEDLLSVSRELLDAGVGVLLDVTRAQAQLQTMRSQLVSARADADRADLALLRALNVSLDTPVVLVAPGRKGLSTGVPAHVDWEVTAALGRRPDVAELDLRIDAARADVEAVRAEWLPTAALEAGQGATGRELDHLLSTYEWTVRVSVPVFDGNRRRSRVDATRARAESLEVQRTELTQQVEFEVRDALLRIRGAVELTAASQAGLELAEAELAQARDRFEAGVAGSADVFTASLRLNEARTAVVDARAAEAAARVTFAVASGTVLEVF